MPLAPVGLIQYMPVTPVRLIQYMPVTPVRLIQYMSVAPVWLIQYMPVAPIRLIQCMPLAPTGLIQYMPLAPVRLIQYVPVAPIKLIEYMPDIVSCGLMVSKWFTNYDLSAVNSKSVVCITDSQPFVPCVPQAIFQKPYAQQVKTGLSFWEMCFYSYAYCLQVKSHLSPNIP
jgi:hypothetical protein